jgi:hypothetical protein
VRWWRCTCCIRTRVTTRTRLLRQTQGLKDWKTWRRRRNNTNSHRLVTVESLLCSHGALEIVALLDGFGNGC